MLGAAREGFDELGLEILWRKLQFRRNGGQADVVVEAGEKSAAAGSDLDDVGNGGGILTHGGTLDD